MLVALYVIRFGHLVQDALESTLRRRQHARSLLQFEPWARARQPRPHMRMQMDVLLATGHHVPTMGRHVPATCITCQPLSIMCSPLAIIRQPLTTTCCSFSCASHSPLWTGLSPSCASHTPSCAITPPPPPPPPPPAAAMNERARERASDCVGVSKRASVWAIGCATTKWASGREHKWVCKTVSGGVRKYPSKGAANHDEAHHTGRCIRTRVHVCVSE